MTEPGPAFVDRVGGQMMLIEAALVARLGADFVAEVLPQGVGHGGW